MRGSLLPASCVRRGINDDRSVHPTYALDGDIEHIWLWVDPSLSFVFGSHHVHLNLEQVHRACLRVGSLLKSRKLINYILAQVVAQVHLKLSLTPLALSS